MPGCSGPELAAEGSLKASPRSVPMAMRAATVGRLQKKYSVVSCISMAASTLSYCAEPGFQVWKSTFQAGGPLCLPCRHSE